MKQCKGVPPQCMTLFICVGILLVVSLCSPWIAPYDPYATHPDMVLQAPSAAHWFGTDEHGRDILSRVLVGSQTSLFAAFAIIVCASILGTAIGLVAGYAGGKVDSVLMRVTDVFLSFPDLVLAIAVAGILGGGLLNAMFALLFTTWTQYARLARSAVLSVKEETYVVAAVLSGCSHQRIVWRHILPNIVGTLIVTATLHVSGMIMGIAGLSFLGLGVKVPGAEWGAMISGGRQFLQTAPWVALCPSAVMVAVLILFNLLGDAVRDWMDPKQREE